MHSAAKTIVAKHDGEFPRELKAALDLPGIGHYTAAAVLSIAYDEPLAVLDGNVARVLARLAAVRGDLREPRAWRNLSNTAQQLLARDAASDWNQALMELGETICTPQSPHCAACPISRWCESHAQGLANEIPAPRKKRAAVNIKIAAAILCDPQGRTLLVKEPGAHDHVLFSRMWQFPATEVKRNARSRTHKTSPLYSRHERRSTRSPARSPPRRNISQCDIASLSRPRRPIACEGRNTRPRSATQEHCPASNFKRNSQNRRRSYRPHKTPETKAG